MTPLGSFGHRRASRASSSCSSSVLQADVEETSAHNLGRPRHAKPPVEVVVTPTDAAHTSWMPIWLRRRSLFALATLFASMAASLIVLWAVNNSSHGFRPLLSTNHYAWTYGPTAILVCVLALWRQVDYYCKLVQPWQDLSKGEVDAKCSMLLDHLSPMLVSGMVQAIGHRHGFFAVSIPGFGILKVIILLSTGLLTLTPVQYTGPQPVLLNSRFDTTNLQGTAPDSPTTF